MNEDINKPRYFNGESGCYMNCACGKRCSPSYLEANGGSCDDCKTRKRIEELERRCARMEETIEELKSTRMLNNGLPSNFVDCGKILPNDDPYWKKCPDNLMRFGSDPGDVPSFGSGGGGWGSGWGSADGFKPEKTYNQGEMN